MAERRAAVYAESVRLRRLSYRFELDCPRCGGPLQHVTGGTSNGASTRAVTRCTDCRSGWLVTASIEQVAEAVGSNPHRASAQCATDSGYYAHRDRHEPPCQPCRDAHAAAERARNARRRGQRPKRRELARSSTDKGGLSSCPQSASVWTIEPMNKNEIR
jgi:hypothetical protein